MISIHSLRQKSVIRAKVEITYNKEISLLVNYLIAASVCRTKIFLLNKQLDIEESHAMPLDADSTKILDN